MTEEITAPDGAIPPEPPADTGTPTSLADIQAELEKTRNALRNANKEAAERRKKLEAFEASERERQEKELSEAQKLAKRLEEHQAELAQERQLRETTEARLRRVLIENSVTLKAVDLGFEHPEDALALLDLSKVEITEEGKVKGFEKALEELAKSNRLPMRKAQGAGIGTPRIPGRAPGVKPEPDKQPARLGIRL